MTEEKETQRTLFSEFGKQRNCPDCTEVLEVMGTLSGAAEVAYDTVMQDCQRVLQEHPNHREPE